MGPATLKVLKLSWPGWVVISVGAAGGALLLVATPLMQARLDALVQRAKRQDERAGQQETALEPLLGSARRMPLVREVTDRGLLEIHPAIPLRAGADPSLSPELPTYVVRDVDADVITALRAASAQGGFVLLVGRAAAGKTRCLYEAINTALGEWRLCMPGRAERLTALVSSGVNLTRTVVWLNEIQRFLGDGQLTAETVRRLLSDTKHPVIIVGTIWPEHFERLRATTGNADGQDLNRDSREILELAHKFSLPDRFSLAEQDRAKSLADTDPRLKEALRYSAAGLTGVLAAAPELQHRWRQADNPYGAAVIGAAVQGRRCGHPDLFPGSLLELLAVTYLTRAQRATVSQDWFKAALEWATRPVRGTVAPLTAEAAEVGAVDGYRISDVLAQPATATPPEQEVIPEDFWNTLIGHATPQACMPIARIAYYGGRKDLAEQAFQRAADAGDAIAMSNLGFLLSEQGETEQARTWYQRAADEGHTGAMNNLGNLLSEQGETEQARTWYQRAADAGDTDAMSNLGVLLSEQGETEQARTWYQRAADEGNTDAMHNLGILLRSLGETEQARAWYQLAADEGDTDAMNNLGNLLRDLGESEQARTWFQLAADEGNTMAMRNLGIVLAEQGETEQARSWYQRAADAGETAAMSNLGVLLSEQGEIEQARAWFQRAAGTGETGVSSIELSGGASGTTE